MQYVGSKKRILKEILPIILSDRKPGQYYVEPFAGGFNSISAVNNPRIAGDYHPYLISLMSAIQSGWVPPSDISREEYYNIKNAQDSNSPELVGFVGFLCSFGAKWWGGYAKNKIGFNYARSGRDNLLKQAPLLEGIEIYCCDYNDLPIPANSIIYCDPPYQNTTKYNGTSCFDYEKFWNWCRDKATEGHRVFVSEYSAPEDFECVWEKRITSTLKKDSNSLMRTEKLFTFRKR